MTRITEAVEKSGAFISGDNIAKIDVQACF
jgi:hypothetical protein